MPDILTLDKPLWNEKFETFLENADSVSLHLEVVNGDKLIGKVEMSLAKLVSTPEVSPLLRSHLCK